ncbi:hypothetical protein CF065_18910 [Clostridium sporogenes]|uniref:siphovirus ReqiPepy6 Gp37-like family protein n=1 Tax=Clostridium botulinum TaxID=1491 RepID=UPI003DA389B1
MDIRIFDRDMNFLGEVDNYTSLFYISKWETYGEFEFHVKDFNKELLDKGNIIMLGKDGSRTGVIEHIEVNQEDDEDVMVKGFSLGYWFTNRITVPPVGYAYHTFNINIEDIMLALVNANAVDPLDADRKIPNLVLEASKSRGLKLEFQSRYKNLDEELTKLSKASGLGWTIALDYKNKKFIFKILEGKDLSTEQNINPPQIFSIDYDNIRKQNYLESNIGYKNMAYVAGQGEGEKREIELLNNTLSGFDRRETFIDARDIEEGGNLVDRGKIKLAETPQIDSFQCEVESKDYKNNWNLGDIVTTLDKKLGLIKHNRVTEVKEIWESDYKIEPTFGTTIPTIGEKIKQTQDTPLQESVQGPPGETGQTGERGPQGYSIQCLWNGTKLGVKREDETSYSYVDLKGQKGDAGPKGEQGIQGNPGTGLQFSWNGTKLGIKKETDSSFIYVDLKGATGERGANGLQGIQGLKGDIGPQGPKGDVGPMGPAGEGGTQIIVSNAEPAGVPVGTVWV